MTFAYPDLGMEAIYEFDVQDMPVTVAVDSRDASACRTRQKKQECSRQTAIFRSSKFFKGRDAARFCIGLEAAWIGGLGARRAESQYP